MRLVDQETGEILVARDPFQARIEVHVKGAAGEEDRVIRLARGEARRLAALILFQAERLEVDSRTRVTTIHAVEPKIA